MLHSSHFALGERNKRTFVEWSGFADHSDLCAVRKSQPHYFVDQISNLIAYAADAHFTLMQPTLLESLLQCFPPVPAHLYIT